MTEPERSIAGQIGHACRVSAFEGRTHLRTARDLYDGLDGVRRSFAAGELSARKVTAIVAAAAGLDRAERAEVDRLLTARPLDGLGVGRIRDRALGLVAQVAPQTFLARHTAARSNRRVTLRPAADGMTDLIAHLPAEQGAACYAALCRAFTDAQVSPEPPTRGRGQVMADALVQRLTGQATAGAVTVEVQIRVPVEALVEPNSPLPAEIAGHGPVPVEVLSTTTGQIAWRRLVTRDGIVIGGSSRQRTFPDGLTALIRESPGWHVERTPEGIRTTTPTGHDYLTHV